MCIYTYLHIHMLHVCKGTHMCKFTYTCVYLFGYKIYANNACTQCRKALYCLHVVGQARPTS